MIGALVAALWAALLLGGNGVGIYRSCVISRAIGGDLGYEPGLIKLVSSFRGRQPIIYAPDDINYAVGGETGRFLAFILAAGRVQKVHFPISTWNGHEVPIVHFCNFAAIASGRVDQRQHFLSGGNGVGVNQHTFSRQVANVLEHKADRRFVGFDRARRNGDARNAHPWPLSVLRYVSLSPRLTVGSPSAVSGYACDYYCNERKNKREAPKRLFLFSMVTLFGMPAVAWLLNKDRGFLTGWWWLAAIVFCLSTFCLILFVVTLIAPEL